MAGTAKAWWTEALDAGGEPQREVVCMMDQVDALEEETTEGMEEHENAGAYTRRRIRCTPAGNRVR